MIEAKYHLALTAKERFYAAQDDFENQKVEIVDTINSEDEKIRKSATNKKENFQKSLENLLKISRDLMGYVGMRNTSIVTKEEFDCGKEQKNAKEIMQKLDIAINEEKEQQISILSLPQHNSTAIQSHGDSFLKLKKLSAPKFSGLSREFAKFKRDFNTLVAVEGRNDVEIGATLKESIPRKYHHLVDNLALDQHKKMMKILTTKFGSHRVIVDEIVSEIKKMKQVTNDKMYVNFVDSIDKIQRDLVELKLEQEIANTTIVSELEFKLPTLVQRDWTKHIMEDEEEKSTKEVFDAFMKFLKKTKKQVEYQSSESRQSVSHGKSITISSFVTGSEVRSSGQGGGAQGGGHGGGCDGVQKRGVEERTLFPCLACNSDGVTDLRSTQHPMDSCEVWNSLSMRDKEKKVKCKKHPFATGHTDNECTKTISKCRLCSETSHHFLLCPKRKTSTKSMISTMSMISTSELPPVMVQTAYVSSGRGGSTGCDVRSLLH